MSRRTNCRRCRFLSLNLLSSSPRPSCRMSSPAAQSVSGSSKSTPLPDNVIEVPEPHYDFEPQPPFDYHSLDGKDPTICIDNGSYQWRAGFSTMDSPYILRPNVVARYRERKLGRNTLLFGNDIEVDANSRSSGRSMFDGDILVHGDLLECALDYTFLTLGIDSSRIEQPIVMTEHLTNPIFTRAMTSEILFELYNAPAVTYGIDSLFAFSRHGKRDGLSVHLGNNSSTVIPVVDGRGVISRAKRIPFGGSQASELMLKLAQLKYPSFPLKVTNAQATFMYQETCFFSSDYESELRSLEDPANMAAMTKVVQFPYSQPDVVEKTDEEIAAAMERRKQSGKRLQDMQIKMRAEKLAAKIAELDEYKALLEERTTMKKAEFAKRISDATPFDTEAELDVWMKRTEADIRRKQRRAMGEEPEPEEDPTFPMVDRPDEELNEEELKEKRKQRLMKAGWEARVKLREEKRKEKERLDEVQRLEDEERTNNVEEWSARLRLEQAEVIERLRDRKKRRAQLGDRKSAAAQNRMKSIATLAAEANSGKKRKKGDDERDDGFGRDDSDWAVYREITADDDSEAEEDDIATLQSLESRLLQYDASFTDEDTMEGQVRAKNALLNSFVRGGTGGRFDSESMQQSYQIHLNVERIRVPETWFQPSMFGIDSAGLGELAGWLLNGFNDDERTRLMQCIVLSGGATKLPNLDKRMRNTLTPLLPFQTPFKIYGPVSPGDVSIEAWRGMAEWSATEASRTARVTRAEYDEYGAEWLKEHAWGNVAL